MSQFHTDEYVDFLNRVTPDNVDQFVREQSKCTSPLRAPFCLGQLLMPCVWLSQRG